VSADTAQGRATHQLVSHVGGFSLMLPGTWAAVPMTNAEDVRKRVSAIIKQQMPVADRLASMRRNAREELYKTAAGALDQGATLFAIALELLPGLPFGASILSFVPGWSPAEPLGSDGVEGRLQRNFPGSTLIEHHAGVLARTASMTTVDAFDTSMPALDLQYWLSRDGDDPVVFMVSVPMCPDADLLTEFFDSVIDSVRWNEARDPR
jgi:hypothetical protein